MHVERFFANEETKRGFICECESKRTALGIFKVVILRNLLRRFELEPVGAVMYLLIPQYSCAARHKTLPATRGSLRRLFGTYRI